MPPSSGLIRTRVAATWGQARRDLDVDVERLERAVEGEQRVGPDGRAGDHHRVGVGRRDQLGDFVGRGPVRVAGADDAVTEARIVADGPGEVARLGVAADDHQAPGQEPGGGQLGRDLPEHHVAERQGDEPAQRERRDPQPGHVLTDHEHQHDGQHQADGDRMEQAPHLLRRARAAGRGRTGHRRRR